MQLASSRSYGLPVCVHTRFICFIAGRHDGQPVIVCNHVTNSPVNHLDAATGATVRSIVVMRVLGERRKPTADIHLNGHCSAGDEDTKSQKDGWTSCREPNLLG
jgi:hypothetical protein